LNTDRIYIIVIFLYFSRSDLSNMFGTFSKMSVLLGERLKPSMFRTCSGGVI